MSEICRGRLLRLPLNPPTIPGCTSASLELAPLGPHMASAVTKLHERTAQARTFETLANGDGPTVRRYKGIASVRIRIAPGPSGRPAIRISGATDEALLERARILDDLAKRMVGFVPSEDIELALAEVGKARTAKGLDAALKAAELVANGTTAKITTGLAPTFADIAKEWTDKTLHKSFPDHVPDKDEAEDKQILRDYINPKLGKRRLPDVTLEHAEEVMQSLPPRLGPRSRRHIAQCMRKVLSLAVYPGRHIAVNPIPREWMPKIPKSANKAKSCLFPDEDGKLVSCAAVPLERRIAYGILMREGMRASELGELRWRDVDLGRGRVRLDENKTDDPRAWALSPDVVRVLAWWKKRTAGEADDLVLGGLDLTQGPRWLRGKTWALKTRHKNEVGDLRTAGVDRAELFERSKSRMPIRVHDLRATFVTVSLANGRTEQWVSDRTGHRSSQMLALYTRQARQWSELELGTLQPMDVLLPEMRTACAVQAEARAVGNGGDEVAADALADDLVAEEEAADAVAAGGVAAMPDDQDDAGEDPPFELHPSSGVPARRVPNGYLFAPTAGLEPATRRLTAACSTN
jgi:integrase